MQLKEGLSRIARKSNIQFTLRGQTVSYEQVFSEVGLLPALAKRADQLCSLCLGYGIGVNFNEAQDAQLGIRVVFDDITPMVLRYLCIMDVLYELRQASPSLNKVALDELMYD